MLRIYCTSIGVSKKYSAKPKVCVVQKEACEHQGRTCIQLFIANPPHGEF